jgi:hypothetical protein
VNRPIRSHKQHVMTFLVMTDFTATKNIIHFRAFVLQNYDSRCSVCISNSVSFVSFKNTYQKARDYYHSNIIKVIILYEPWDSTLKTQGSIWCYESWNFHGGEDSVAIFLFMIPCRLVDGY